MGAAFMMRPRKDDYLSVNWLEITGNGTREVQIQIIRQHLVSAGRKLTANGALAVLYLEKTFDYVRSESPDQRSMRACHEPLPSAASHAGIYGFGPDDELIADLIAATVSETHPARFP